MGKCRIAWLPQEYDAKGRRHGRWVVGDLPSCCGWRVSIGLGERDQFPVSDGVDGLVEVA